MISDDTFFMALILSIIILLPIYVTILALAGKIDLHMIFDKRHKCKRCGAIRVGKFCAICGMHKA